MRMESVQEVAIRIAAGSASAKVRRRCSTKPEPRRAQSLSVRQPDGKSVIVSMVAMPRSVVERFHAIVDEGIAIEAAAQSAEAVRH
ncbi:MAG: hypothetical protein U1E40_05890 [Amaricoccus sp.]